MFFLVWLMSVLLSMLVLTGRPHRWLRAHGLERHPAALAQALVLAGSWVLAWASFDPRLDTPVSDVAVMFAYTFLLIYGGILLRLRSMGLS